MDDYNEKDLETATEVKNTGAQHIDVDLAVETDADRRLKEWEAKAVKCPSRNYYGQNCSCNDSAGCRHDDCPFAHWGWR